MNDRHFYTSVSKGVERKPQNKYFGLHSNALYTPAEGLTVSQKGLSQYSYHTEDMAGPLVLISLASVTVSTSFPRECLNQGRMYTMPSWSSLKIGDCASGPAFTSTQAHTHKIRAMDPNAGKSDKRT
jgi:hypothetical protein